MSVPQQALYFVKNSYGVEPKMHTTRCCTNDGQRSSESQDHDFERPIPDSWDFSFDAPSKSYNDPNTYGSGQRCIENVAVENSTPSASPADRVSTDETIVTQPIANTVPSTESPKLSELKQIDVTAIFGDEDEELERIIEEENNGAAWRNCPQVDLENLKKPFEDRRPGEEYTSEHVRELPHEIQTQEVLEPSTSSTKVQDDSAAPDAAPQEPISAEERHRQFLAWACRIRSSFYEKERKEFSGYLRRYVTTMQAYEALEDEDCWLYRRWQLPKGTTGEVHDKPKSPRGPRGPSRLREVEDADEEPPNTKSPEEAVDDPVPIPSSSEDEANGSPSQAASSTSSCSDEEPQDAPHSDEFILDEKLMEGRSGDSATPSETNVPYVYKDWFQEGVLDKLWTIEASSVVIAKHLANRTFGWFGLSL